MNKYYRILDKILATGKTQTNKKGNIQYLLNEQLSLTPADRTTCFFWAKPVPRATRHPV